MRIIGGRLGGLRFKGPPGTQTRPTSERVREGLASALDARGVFNSAAVLDLFAGTGALSFEALSRGARQALLIEQDRRMVKMIRNNAKDLGIIQNIDVICTDLLRNTESIVDRICKNHLEPFDLVFADPPYNLIDEVMPLLVKLAKCGKLKLHSTVALEHATTKPPLHLDIFSPLASYRYGDTTVLLLNYP